MEIIQRFRYSAHSDGFECHTCWLSINTQIRETSLFLTEQQKDKKPAEFRLTLHDLTKITKAIDEKEKYSAGLIVKAVAQKGNMHILPASAISGYWVNLAFLLRVDGAEKSEWFLYAYGKGRYKRPNLNLSRGKSLGYSVYVAISERNREFSGSFEDDRL